MLKGKRALDIEVPFFYLTDGKLTQGIMMRLHMNRFSNVTVSALCAVSLFFPSTALALTTVPSGNVNVEQPAIPGSSKNRTKALNKTFDGKYQKVLRLLKNDRGLISDIKSVSSKFGIDPIHMIGAIVGEFVGSYGGDRAPLGLVITSALRQNQTATVFAAVTLAAFLGFLLFGIVNLVGWLLLRRWHASAQ